MQKTAEHYEHIDAMSEEFAGTVSAGELGTEWQLEHWKIRVLLAIAQQLSMISASLKQK